MNAFRFQTGTHMEHRPEYLTKVNVNEYVDSKTEHDRV